MPEMHFRVRWPDASETTHNSPSLIIEERFSLGETYPIGEFVPRCQAALQIASDRVEAKFGMPCSRAIAQSHDIARRATAFGGGRVTILAFHRPGQEAVP